MSFGFSAKELIDATDCIIRFIIELKQVPEQIRKLKIDLDVSRDQLKGLESVLVSCKNNIDERAAESFDALRKNLYDVLNDTLDFLKRFHPSDPSKSSILSSIGKLRWVVDKKYLGSVEDLRSRISQIEKRIDREINLLSLRYLSKSDQARTQETQPLKEILPLVQKSVAQTEVDNTYVEKETQANIVTNHNPHPGYPLLAVPFGAPPSPPPSPPLHYLVGSRTGAAVLAMNLSSSSLKPQSIRRASTFSNSAAYNFDGIPLTGSVKVWFYTGRQAIHQSFDINTVTLIRHSSGYFCGVHMIRSDGKVLQDEITRPWENTARHPLPVHRRQTRDCFSPNHHPTQFIRFLRSAPSPSYPKFYSFSSVSDYTLFQSRIVRQKLTYWAEVTSISSRWSKTPLCENQVLQLWEGQAGGKEIRFFRGGKDGVYSVHRVDCLRLNSEDEAGRLLELRFIGIGLKEQEIKMRWLEIVFVNTDRMIEFRRRAGFIERR